MLLVGYAHVATEQQDLTAQSNGLQALGVGDDRTYEPFHEQNSASDAKRCRTNDGDHPRSLLDYARQKLFDPLGVDTEPAYTGYEWQAPPTSRFEEAGFGWATDKRGRFYGAFGIRLRARDMANFGQLFLDEGRWNGQQLVPERWVRDATTRIELARYGRLWWDVDVGLHPAFAAMGSDGKLVPVVPKLRLVVAIQRSPTTSTSFLPTP